ncbi:tyrosine-type recombinase/integrase [Azospirillum sp. sgz301742]
MTDVRIFQSNGYYREVVPVPDTYATLLRRKDSKNWYVRLIIPGVDTPRPKSTGKSNLDEAMAVARELSRKTVIKLYREEPITEPVMKDLFEEFIAWVRKRNPLHDHVRRHEGISRNHVLPMFGTRHLSSLTQKDAERFTQKRMKDGAKLSTIAVDLVTLRTWSEFAVEKGYRRDKIRAPIKQQPPDDYDNSYFDLRTFVKLRRALRYEHEELHLLVLFCYHTGCRVVEARNFRHEDVVKKWNPKTGEPARIHLRGKQKKRTIPVLPVVQTIVEKVGFVRGGRTSGPVFSDLKRLSEQFHYFLLREGLYEDGEGNHRTLGSLRHTRATLELQRGRARPGRLAAWMGHTEREQARTYDKVLAEMQAEGLFRRRPKR